MMKRRAHYLKPNERSETIHQCIFYDCETTPSKQSDGTTKHILEFGWAAYTRRRPNGLWARPSWFRFQTGKELWQWVDSKTRTKKTLYMWAHNHFFDYTTSSGSSCLRSLGWTLESAIIDSPPFVMKYARSSSKLILVDTLNIWRMSLAQMGKLVVLDKLSMPYSWTGTNEDDVYCRRDVEIIQKAVTEWADFLRDSDMGKFCLTVASQAMQTFRHRYLEGNILIDADREALRISRASYRGGRVECFRIGKLTGPLYLLDVNSLYPFCMATSTFPVKLMGTFANPGIIEITYLLKKFLLCAFVKCEVRSPVIGIKHEGKLIFPVGTFDAYVTTPELEYLLKEEKVISVQACAVYEKATPFVQFVNDLYERRTRAAVDGDLVKSGHYKLLLNSFSGKWGQNGIKWTEIGKHTDDSIGFHRSINAQTHEVTDYRWFNGLVQSRSTTPESFESHPAIAAHITAYGRMVLWALMRKVTPENYFYCDTDSLLVSEDGLKQVSDSIHDVRLGALKVVKKVADAFIYGPKDYVLGGVRTVKGIRDKAVNTGINTFSQDRWFGFRSSLRKGFTDAPRMTTVVKTLARVYNKGSVADDGRVLPFHLPLP